MDWLQFFSAIIGHLAWPAVLLIVIISIRKHLGSLAERILELSFGGAKVTFDKALQKGAEIIDVSPLPPQSLPSQEEEPQLPPPVGNAGGPAVNIHPDVKQSNVRWLSTGIGRIISSYEGIDELIRSLGDMIGLKTKNGAQIMESLYKRGYVPDEMRQLYRELREGRNAVAHARALPNEDEIVEYERQASYLSSVLAELHQRLRRLRDQFE